MKQKRPSGFQQITDDELMSIIKRATKVMLWLAPNHYNEIFSAAQYGAAVAMKQNYDDIDLGAQIYIKARYAILDYFRDHQSLVRVPRTEQYVGNDTRKLVFSLNEPHDGDEGDPQNNVPAREIFPTEHSERIEVLRAIGFTESEITIAVGLSLGKTQRDLAKHLSVSASRISQLVKSMRAKATQHAGEILELFKA